MGPMEIRSQSADAKDDSKVRPRKRIKIITNNDFPVRLGLRTLR